MPRGRWDTCQLTRARQGTVSAIAATRHRLIFGPTEWIDVWTTKVIPENEQLRRIVDELVRGISPAPRTSGIH